MNAGTPGWLEGAPGIAAPDADDAAGAPAEPPPAAVGQVAERHGAETRPPEMHNVTVAGSQATQVGDNNVQNNIWNITLRPAPGQVPDRIVVGSIPQEPLAFQPREHLMLRLRTAGAGISLVSTVTGMRGVGKTQLAAGYARERANAGWRLVAWVNAETIPEILASLAVIADRLRLIPDSGSAGRLDLEATATLVRNHLETGGDRSLIVFDNATDLRAVSRYVPVLGKCQVVITSTVTGSAALGRHALVPVDVFTADESLAFLAERTGLQPGPHVKITGGRGSAIAQEGAAALAQELGHLPLALAQAAGVIAAQRLTFPVYLQRLRLLPLSEYLTPETGEAYPRGAAEAIVLSLDTVARADSTGQCGPLLDLIALLSPSGVSRDLLYLTNPESPAHLVDAALARLAGASLLTYTADGATVTSHRLVTRVIRERGARDGTLPGTATVACAILRAARESLGQAWQDRAAVRSWIDHVTALTASTSRGFENWDAALTESLLELRASALGYLDDLGDSAGQAIQIGEPVVADCERMLGASHPDTLTSRSHLAEAYYAAGRLGEAIALYEAVLADRGRVLGDAHPDTLTSGSDLAVAYAAAGRSGEAIALYEAVLADRKRVLGDAHPDTLTSRNNLAAEYQSAGRSSDAIRLFEELLAQREQMLGDSHPGTLLSRNNLANVYQAAGRLDEAIVLYEATLAEYERTLGDSHPDALRTRGNLAYAYQSAGRLDEAIPLYEATLAGREQMLGDSHPDTLASRNNLARSYREAGRLDEAIVLYEATLAEYERTLGASYPPALAARNGLAHAYELAGRPAEAIPLYESALTGLERISGAEHPWTVTVRENLQRARAKAHREGK